MQHAACGMRAAGVLAIPELVVETCPHEFGNDVFAISTTERLGLPCVLVAHLPQVFLGPLSGSGGNSQRRRPSPNHPPPTQILHTTAIMVHNNNQQKPNYLAVAQSSALLTTK